jgi:hypothetical protein
MQGRMRERIEYAAAWIGLKALGALPRRLARAEMQSSIKPRFSCHYVVAAEAAAHKDHL